MATQALMVRRYAPSLSFLHSSYTGPINIALTLGVTATDSNTDGTITAIRYRVVEPVADTVHTLAGTARSWEMTFERPETCMVEAWAVDDDGFSSQPATVKVVVTAGVPYFTKGNQDLPLYIKDTTTLRVAAQSGAAGVAVSRYIWMRGANVLQNGASDSLAVSYTAAQLDTIRVWAVNGRGDTCAAPAVIAITVSSGAPIVQTITPDSLKTFMNTDLRVRIKGRDINGLLKLMEIDEDGDGTPDRTLSMSRDSIDTTMTVTYVTSGAKVLQVRLTDDDGVSSGWVNSDTITVNPGIPVVTGLTPDTAVWAFDAVRITVAASDNGSIVACSLSVNATQWRGYASLGIDTMFTSAGVKRFWVKVKDNDGNVSTAYSDSVVVRLGAPVVYAVRGDTARDSVFVRDLRRDTVWYGDTNGTVFAVYANWTGGEAAQDSVVVNKRGGFAVFSHEWDTTQAGERHPKFWVTDDDGLQSVTYTDTVSVRLGAPRVWGETPEAAQDTVFLIVDREYGNYYYRPKYADTNGVITHFYFGLTATFANATETTADSALLIVDQNTINKGSDRYIWVKDDDGLVRGGRFVVFADSAPTAPTFFQNGVAGDSVVLKWEKRLDYKDGLQTRVQIVSCFGSGCPPSDSLYASGAWPTLAEIEAKWPTENIGGIICNVVKFKAQQSGAGRWRVVLKDARETKTQGSDVSTFVAP